MNYILASLDTISSLQQIDIEHIDTHTLIIFDLINTLVDPEDEGKLIEPLCLGVIQKLQERGAKILIMSHVIIRSPESAEQCYQLLHNLGINLTHSFDKNNFTLKMFDQVLPHKPVYYNGILFTNGYPKAEVLRDFLHEMAFVPSKVIFIDDHLEYVCSVQRSMMQKKIPFQGYHYIGAV